jgi:hypothetical protein
MNMVHGIRMVALTTRHWRTAFLGAVLGCLLLLPFAMAQQSLLPAPSSQFQFAGTFVSGRTFPTASGGYLISFPRTATLGHPTSISLDSPTLGHRVVPFAIQGADKTVLTSVAVDESGALILAGFYTTPIGALPESIRNSYAAVSHNFYATVSITTGDVLTTTDLGGYLPERVCSTSEGSIWFLGQVLWEEGPGATYSLVRRYSSTGNLLGAFLPRNAIPAASLNFSPGGKVFGRSGNPAALSCGTSSVGVFLGSPVLSWTEIQVSSSAVQQWVLQPMQGTTFAGLVLLSPQRVYAGFQRGSSAAQLYNLSLTRSGGQWIPVTSAATSAVSAGTPLGRDGSSLVYVTGAAPAASLPTEPPKVYWVTP